MSQPSRDAALETCWAEEGEKKPKSLLPSRSMAPSKAAGAATLLYNAMIAPIVRLSAPAPALDCSSRRPEPGALNTGTVPKQNNMHHNLVVAMSNSSHADAGCFCFDDGTSYYDVHHNFCAPQELPWTPALSLPLQTSTLL